MDDFNFKEELREYIDQQEMKELKYSLDDGYDIPDMATANYVVKKLKEVREQKQAIEQQAQEALDEYTIKVDSFKRGALAPLDYAEERYVQQLTMFLEHNLTGKQRSIKLINGTIGFRKNQPRIIYDEEALLNFLEEKGLDEYLQTKTMLNKKEIRSQLLSQNPKDCPTLGGVPLSGVMIEEQPDSFTLK